MIKIITIGNLKEKYLQEAAQEYKKRLSKFTKLEIIEIKETNKKTETQAIIKNLKENSYNILLAIDGKQYTSKELSKKIEEIFIYRASDITFIIGGSEGINNNIEKYINEKVSFSKLTFPHQLFRINLLEQIYRSYKIINNEPYHK